MSTIRIPVIMNSAAPGAPYMNVWNLRLAGDSNNNGDALSDALQELKQFYTTVAQGMADGVTIRAGEGMIEDPYGSPTYVNDNPWQVVTANSGGGTAPALLAVVVSWRTSSASRSGRGRTFVGPMKPNTQSPDGTPTPEILGLIRGAATDLVTASTGVGGWSFGVYSAKQNLLRDFTGSTVKDRWSFLSSRRD